MDSNLINLDDLQNALEELKEKEVNYDKLEDTEEMKASKFRYEEYIKKNAKQE
jgi:hypothetical protein